MVIRLKKKYAKGRKKALNFFWWSPHIFTTGAATSEFEGVRTLTPSPTREVDAASLPPPPPFLLSPFPTKLAPADPSAVSLSSLALPSPPPSPAAQSLERPEDEVAGMSRTGGQLAGPSRGTGTNKNRDVSTGPLAHFAHSLARGKVNF